MPQNSNSQNDRLVPSQPTPTASAQEGMEDEIDLIAAGLYSMAAMLVGKGEDSARLVEMTIESAENPVCHDPAAAQLSCRKALCASAVEVLEQRNPGCLAAPKGLKAAKTCIEDDDLDAAAEYGDELKRLIAGPDRERVRKWLESLATPMRTIFVLRAVGGLSTAETAGLLATQGGPQAAGWTVDEVRESLRQGLCSLASQLLQSTAGAVK
jgi:hypothetical protein